MESSRTEKTQDDLEVYYRLGVEVDWKDMEIGEINGF